jgi:5-methylcytosine-specific restriction endonuclease McrA
MSPWNSTLKAGKPIRAKSEKRVKEDRAWAKLRLEVLFRDGHCAFILDTTHGPCGGPLDVHHIVTRARDRKLALDADNLKVVCRVHHDWVHAHPAEATELGLLASSPVFPNPPQKTPKP